MRAPSASPRRRLQHLRRAVRIDASQPNLLGRRHRQAGGGAMTDAAAEVARLTAENAKLKKINAALMSRVERAMDQPNNAFGLFEVAITLDKTVRRRTAEVQAALRSVEGANEALQKAKQLAEKANAFKSTFLAFVSHDLLQPLNAARLNLSTLSEAAPDDEVRRLARQIDLALTSLEDL